MFSINNISRNDEEGLHHNQLHGSLISAEPLEDQVPALHIQYK